MADAIGESADGALVLAEDGDLSGPVIDAHDGRVATPGRTGQRARGPVVGLDRRWQELVARVDRIARHVAEAGVVDAGSGGRPAREDGQAGSIGQGTRNPRRIGREAPRTSPWAAG